MATGKSADSIYKLIEDLNCSGIDYGSNVVLSELVRYLDADTLEVFISYFRRNHDMEEVDDDDESYEEPDYHLCMDCQASYDINKMHICDVDETQPPSGTSKYFSSLIPEC